MTMEDMEQFRLEPTGSTPILFVGRQEWYYSAGENSPAQAHFIYSIYSTISRHWIFKSEFVPSKDDPSAKGSITVQTFGSRMVCILRACNDVADPAIRQAILSHFEGAE